MYNVIISGSAYEDIDSQLEYLQRKFKSKQVIDAMMDDMNDILEDIKMYFQTIRFVIKKELI